MWTVSVKAAQSELNESGRHKGTPYATHERKQSRALLKFIYRWRAIELGFLRIVAHQMFIVLYWHCMLCAPTNFNN